MDIMQNQDEGRPKSINLRQSRCTWQDGVLDFLARDNLLGWKQLKFEVTVDGTSFISSNLTWRLMPSASNQIVATARPGNSPLEIVVIIKADVDRNILRIRCRYRNRSQRTLRLTNVVDGRGRLLCPQGRVFHIENIKQMCVSFAHDGPPDGGRVDHGTVLCGDKYWRDLGPEIRYGRSEDQPYPALFLVSPQSGRGLVDAQFSQDRWYREVVIAADEADRSSYAYCGEMTTRGVNAVLLPPGNVINGESTFLQICGHADLQHAFDDYNRELWDCYDFRATHSPNRRELIWGSWNLGIWADCSDELVVGNARIIKEHFPPVKWVQIDEGWATVPGGAMGCPLYEGIDRERFPRGMAAVARDIKTLGLRPALWCGMSISPEAQVVRSHPEWLLRQSDGSPHIAGRNILDYSRQDVRDFVVRTYRRIIHDWGYEGIKLDFWTYGFEDNDIVYACEDRTSLELRTWWLKTLRALLPEDGYIELGCNVNSISPFVARFVDNIRWGIDVGIGDNLQAIRDTASWVAAHSLFAPGKLYLPNSDAIGAMKKMTPAMKRSWLSFCGVTGSAVELGGDLRKETPADWADAKRILDGVTIGGPFRPIDFGSPPNPVPPAIWFSEKGLVSSEGVQPAGFLCIFNWTGEGSRRESVKFSELGLPGKRYRIINFWTGEEHLCTDSLKIPKIPDHDVFAVHLYKCEMDGNEGK